MAKTVKFRHVLHTNGKGLWSRAAKEVATLHLTLSIWNSMGTFGELRVYFDTNSWSVRKDGLIYTDELFMRELRKALSNFLDARVGTSVDYSEQGMQGRNYVSCDVDERFISLWEGLPYKNLD